jgi:hypothetical protein
MSRIWTRAIGAIAAGTIALVPATAGADAQPATHVDSVNVSTGGSLITVSGTAGFVDIPVQIGQDPSGDAFAAGYGADVTNITISRPVGSNVLFTFDVADQPAAPAEASPAIVYQWPIAVNGEDNGMYLQAGRVNGNAGNTNKAWFLLQDGADGFSVRTTLTGILGGGKVTWPLNSGAMNALGLTPGAVITQGAAGLGQFGTTFGLAGRVFLNQNTTGDAVFQEVDYVVPSATVQLGIAPAGTPAEAVALSSAAAVTVATGAYSGSIPKPGPGSYIVVAKACYGPSSCGLSSTTITI